MRKLVETNARRQAMRWGGAMAALPWLGGCASALASLGGLVGIAVARPPSWESLVVSADRGANRDTPTAVDIVLVRDKALVDPMASMPAARWFATRQDLIRTHPQGITVINLEVVPSQAVRVARTAWADSRALASLVFADYPTPGDHRERLLLDHPGYVVQLSAAGFKATDAPRR